MAKEKKTVPSTDATQLAALTALAPPIYPATVYACSSPQQAADLLAGNTEGFIYSRDGHPNSDMLAEQCKTWHGADQAVIAGSGMAALAGHDFTTSARRPRPDQPSTLWSNTWFIYN